MKIVPLLLCLICFYATAFAAPFVRPETVSESQWKELQPYLLPANHPVRAKLDRIFDTQGIIASPESLKKFKFSFKKGSRSGNVYIAKHPSLSKYILKLYTDDQIHVNEIPSLVKRIQGANIIRDIINRDKMHVYFKVPKKWLYPLPHTAGKRFILVAENMKLVSTAENGRVWKGPAVTEEHLRHLHAILAEAGLYDSIYIDNIPFCRDGCIAFVDTEHFNLWPIRFDRLTPHLSSRNKTYWTALWK